MNKSKKEFKECEPELEQKAAETAPDQMIALEWKEDIYSDDSFRAHKVFHKITGTRIKEKVRKLEVIV